MYIFEIIVPGTWLDYEDLEWKRNINQQLYGLQTQFFEANLALNLFTSAQSSSYHSFSKDKWDADLKRKQEISDSLEQEYKKQERNYWEIRDEIRLQTEMIFKREKWQQGVMPIEFEHNLSSLYARSFIYAVDSFDKFLTVLVKAKDIPEAIIEIHENISVIFPNLRLVRNSIQHLEDRARSLGAGKNPKLLDLKPINNSFIHAPNGGVLILNAINGSSIGSTMSDGHYGEVDVSPESMRHLQEILQNTLQSFKWKGPKQHKPSI